MRTVADVAQLIVDHVGARNPIIPAVTLGEDGDYVLVRLQGTLRRALYAVPIPVEVPGNVFITRMGRNPLSPLIVVATNYQVPPGADADYGYVRLVDGGPGPDGVYGTPDDDAGAGFDLTDGPGGPRLVE